MHVIIEKVAKSFHLAMLKAGQKFGKQGEPAICAEQATWVSTT